MTPLQCSIFQQGDSWDLLPLLSYYGLFSLLGNPSDLTLFTPSFSFAFSARRPVKPDTLLRPSIRIIIFLYSEIRGTCQPSRLFLRFGDLQDLLPSAVPLLLPPPSWPLRFCMTWISRIKLVTLHFKSFQEHKRHCTDPTKNIIG